MAGTDEQFLALENAWADAITRRDRQDLDRVLADEFVLTNVQVPDFVRGKGDWVENVVRRLDTRSILVHSLRASVFDEIAVVTCLLDWEALWDSSDVSGKFAVCDVWRSSAGDWTVVWRSLSATEWGTRLIGDVHDFAQ